MIEHDIEHRDAFASLARMRELGGARLIVTSPPYPDARREAQYGCDAFDTSLAGYGRLGEAIFDALMPGGVCAFNIDGPVRVWRETFSGQQHHERVAGSDSLRSERSLIALKLAIDWAERIGFRYIERAAYVKAGQPGEFGPRWRCGFELVHIFARPGGEVFFDGWGVTEPAIHAGKTYGPSRSRNTATAGGWHTSPGYTSGDRRQITTAIESPTGQLLDTDHSAPFSPRLADAFVLCYSQPGDLVGDPFVGSGTVAISCNTHGRRFVGGDLGHREKDGRRWADIVRERVAQRGLFEALA